MTLTRLGMALALAALICGGCDDATSDETSPDMSSDSAVDGGDESDADAADLVSDADDAADLATGADDASEEPDAFVWPPLVMTVDEALDAVDPFIGTGGLGYGFAALTPAAQVPFGMVRLGPDTTNGGIHPDFTHYGGYNVTDRHVRGFSHTHFVGTGVADYGNLRVLPTTGLPDDPGAHFRALDKTTEHAEPGLYEVELVDGVAVALTSSLRCGVHRYELLSDGGYLLFDTAASVRDEGVVASVTRVTSSAIDGWVEYDGGYVGRTLPFTLHFSATIEPPAAQVFVWDDEGYDEAAGQATGVATGAVLRFDGSEPVVLRVGLSYVDADQAAANRETEVDGLSFDEVAAANRALWADKLGRVRIGGVDEELATIFYTSLYNVYRMPTRFDGVDGRYRGLDGEVHEGTGFGYHSDLSLWDTFRTLHPWLVLTDADAQRDMLLSLMAMCEQGGYFPRWPAALSYTNGMIGTSADIVFAGSALKGISGVDYNAAFDGLLATATGPTEPGHPFSGRRGIEDYLALGYVSDAQSVSVSRTLEYAYADFALANLADHLGREEAAALRERGRSYRNLYEAESGFFLPRDGDGNFDTSVETGRIFMNDGPYTEGSAWHWRFYALQDPEDLRELMGGAEALGDALEQLFAQSAIGRPAPIQTALPDVYYWHGNEPTVHAAYLFHAADRYDRLAHWVREIQTRLYSAEPSGIPGNDDGGTLSSWYLFNAIGLYPVAGSDRYALSTPIVPYAEVDLPDGTQLTVVAEGANVERRYVRSVRFGDEVVEGGYVSHGDLSDATLVFEMSDP